MLHSRKQVSFVQGWIILIIIILSFGGHRSHGLKRKAYKSKEFMTYFSQYVSVAHFVLIEKVSINHPERMLKSYHNTVMNVYVDLFLHLVKETNLCTNL